MAMNVLTDRLQQALDQQKRFVSDAAHELRTPLAALRLQFDNLRATAHSEQLPLLIDLDGGLRRAGALVEQLLRLARSEEAPIAEKGTIDLSELVAQCVADFVPIADAKGVDLGLSSHESISIHGGRADLTLLFGNLIDNAIRYTPSGGMVDVSARKTTDTFVVEVVDTGCGVADTDIPRLFDRFFRAAPADVDGSGLGLSIAGAVAKHHDYAIEIENRRDRSGLRVCVTGRLDCEQLIRS
jgi:two-component system OmpR family sensor kinase